jgi:hypothetical protein
MKETIAPMRHSLFFIVLFSLLYVHAAAQNLDNTLATYATTYTPERAYLHYDKSTYAAGETIWFKAYLMEGILPAQGSKTLYIDWVNEKGAVLAHFVNPVVDAVTNGQFEIPSDYAGNFIHVRAYTRWMLNFDSSFLYNKDIDVVGNGQRSASKPTAITTELQFFPEGGDAITGIKNKIAFLAADQWGRPVNVSGIIQNNTGAEVTKFTSSHDGMGFFYLEPQPGVPYTAKWKDSKGATHSTPLPATKSSGVVLEITPQDTKRRFTLTRPDNAPEAFKQLYLVGTMDGNLVFKTPIDLNATATKSALIPTEALPTGILVITVFDASWNAVAERIAFVKNSDYAFVPELTVAHWGLNKRARNEIQISVPDSLESNLSVSVTDVALRADSTDNIFTRLLLTSNIKGYVAHPEYYFASNSDTVQQHLDLVMLTHGWRRFKWEDVVKGKLPAITFPKDTAYLTLSGNLYGAQSGGAAGSILMFVKAKDTSAQMLMETIQPNGTFNDPASIFFDTLQVYYQLQPAKTFKGADVRFLQDRLPPLQYSAVAKQFMGHVLYNDTTGNYRLLQLAQERAKAGELMKEKMLANVTVRTKGKTPLQVMDEKYASGLFSGSDSRQFDLVNDPQAGAYSSIFQYLQGKVAGLQITTGGAPGQTSLQWRGSTPAVFIDQINTNIEMLETLPVSDIAYVKVFQPPFMGASGGGSGGAIAIYTRKGSDAPMARGKGLNKAIITGYTPAKEFYAPNYDRFDPRNEERDLRTTLYWNPAVLTSPKKHTVTLAFYNNDITKAFRVVIEGMTKDGRLAHVEQIME